MRGAVRMSVCLAVITLATGGLAWAQDSDSQPPPPPAGIEWQLGGFLDIGYLHDFNSPSNHLFRSRGTTARVDEFIVNMGGAYARKKPSDSSRWGLEVTTHGGEDSKLFGFSGTAPSMDGGNWLRYFGPTNISYVAPVGSGLTLQGGIFNSFIGIDSLYSKDNYNYTRPWAADFIPYLMLGVNAAYPVTENLTATAFVVNGYFHLSHANNVPSIGGQLAYKATDRVTVKQTLLYGPHQTETSLPFWRFFSDSIVERRAGRLTTLFELQVGTEAVDVPGARRALWLAAQAPIRWSINGPWSVTLRPELAWDRDARWTTFEQTVRAMTSTVEFRPRLGRGESIFRLEHRYDHSTGTDGGFFRDMEPGVVGLTSGQHLLILGWILTFDTTTRF